MSFSDFRYQGGFCVSLPVTSRTSILCEPKDLHLDQVALTRAAAFIVKAAFSELFNQLKGYSTRTPTYLAGYRYLAFPARELHI